MSTVAVTGASGFVGGVVSNALTAAGHRVISLGRRPLPGEYRGYSLEGPITDGTFSEVDAVVHCAYDVTLTDPRDIDRVNVRGTAMLTEAAVQSGARVFLVSSMSAYPGTRQIYGQAKLRCERVVLEAGGEAVRLGLVWGSARGGMIGTLERLAALPVVPSFGGEVYQFTVHADDVGAAFISLVGGDHRGEPLGLANPERVPFERILADLSPRSEPRFLRLPWPPVYGALRFGEKVGLPLPVRADSLLGLVRAAPEVPNAGYWATVGVRLRAFGATDTGGSPLSP